MSSKSFRPSAAAAAASGGGRSAKRLRAAPKGKPYRSTWVKAISVRRAAVPRPLSLKWGRGPFPPELHTVFSYSETNVLSSSLGANANYTIRMNGPYDPNQTASGTQPRYWDTLLGATDTAAPYSRYCVYSAEIQATFALTVTGATTPTICYLFPKGATQTDPSNYKELMERAEAISTVLSNPGARGVGTLRMHQRVQPWVARAMFDDGLWALYNAVPSQQAYFVLGIVPMDGSTSITCNVNWTITYHLKLGQMNDVADS